MNLDQLPPLIRLRIAKDIALQWEDVAAACNIKPATVRAAVHKGAIPNEFAAWLVEMLANDGFLLCDFGEALRVSGCSAVIKHFEGTTVLNEPEINGTVMQLIFGMFLKNVRQSQTVIFVLKIRSFKL